MTIKKTRHFLEWESRLRDFRAKVRVQARIRRLSLGNAGDAKSVGEGVMEMRIHYGPGYRVYFTRRGGELVVLLVGGDKSTQSRDVELAKRIAGNLESQEDRR